MSSDNQCMVSITGLTVRYGRHEAVRELGLTIPRGEIFGFIGPNGAGKTTTIKVLATLLKPTAGGVMVSGVDVARHPEKVRRLIGYLPDAFGVYEDLTVREYLHFFAAAYRLDVARREQGVLDVLALTDLTGKVDAQVDSLSRGMKQRLGVARILLHDPELLLLDEPASGLDPRARIELRELLKELQRMGKTILISSHILHELSQFCTRIGIIEAGRMVAEGSLDDIYRKLDLKRVVHIQSSNLTPELCDRIRGLPGVVSVQESADRLSVSIREDELPLEDLSAALHAFGIRLRMFQPEAMDM
jgi:ABC-2 type transport system ATP-binding protein